MCRAVSDGKGTVLNSKNGTLNGNSTVTEILSINWDKCETDYAILFLENKCLDSAVMGVNYSLNAKVK